MQPFGDSPAFPVPPAAGHRGLTVRDWLAAMALQGLLAKGLEIRADRALSEEDRENELVRRAYRLSDAMLRNRDIRSPSSRPAAAEATSAALPAEPVAAGR